MNNQERKEIVTALLRLNAPLHDIERDLLKLSWDCKEDEKIIFSRKDAMMILFRFIEDDLTAEDVSDWANLIEGRDDIIYEASASSELMKLIFELANPDLNGPLTKPTAKEWVNKLSKSESE